jgi:hypothetical protein
MPSTGGFDFTPLALLLIIKVLQIVVSNLRWTRFNAQNSQFIGVDFCINDFDDKLQHAV